MLINVYGGPGSQQVDERFKVNWGYYLATNKNVIYGAIDGRGSGFKGDKILHELYHKLGTVEIEDQISVTKYEIMISGKILIIIYFTDNFKIGSILLTRIEQGYGDGVTAGT